jgi:guanylate kinase
VLERRLRGRSKDSEEAIQRRLQTAREEVAAVLEYDYVVVNDELEACVDRVRSIVLAERARLRSMRATTDEVIATFEASRTGDGTAKRRGAATQERGPNSDR